MGKQVILGIIALLALAASIVMFVMKDSSHLTEFKHTWWLPLPIFGLCAAGAFKSNNKT